MESKTTLLEDIASHKNKILSVVQIAVLEDRYKTLAEQTLNIKSRLEAERKRLPVLKQSFTHRDTSKGLVHWLTDVYSVLQEPVSADSLESATREIEVHYETKKALVDNTQVIEETVRNAQALDVSAGFLSEEDTKAGVLEELWRSVQDSTSKRTQELEKCVGLWTLYEEDMLHVMTCLTQGELAMAEVKSSRGNTKDVLRNSLERIEVSFKTKIYDFVANAWPLLNVSILFAFPTRWREQDLRTQAKC